MRVPTFARGELAPLPGPLIDKAIELTRDPLTNEGVLEVWDRKEEFDTVRTAVLAGIALSPLARQQFDDAMENFFNDYTPEPLARRSIIIGGGPHAAIAAATLYYRQGIKPLVIERGRVGGIFARAKRPVFYLNSRNKPGDAPGVPGGPGPLNYLPNGLLQLADFGMGEYQTNADLAFATRVTLAGCSTVVKAEAVFKGFPASDGKWTIDGEGIRYRRAFKATGLGEPRADYIHPKVMDFTRFLEYMDRPFPLRGLKRVAVVGAGDSGKVAVEMLMGQGPNTMGSLTLDALPSVFWFGQESLYKEDFEECVRSRYAPLGRFFPSGRDGQRAFKITPRSSRPIDVYHRAGGACPALVFSDNGLSIVFDLIVWCNGFEEPKFPSSTSIRGDYARKVGRTYYVGPCADLPVTEAEIANVPALGKIKENRVGLFRYGPKTRDAVAGVLG